MRIEVYQFEKDENHPKKSWKQKKHIATITPDIHSFMIPEKDRILIIYDEKTREKRYHIDRVRYVWNENTSEFYLYLIVSKVKVEEP